MKILTLEETLSKFDPADYNETFVIPTETVYGLAARIDRDDSLRQIYTIKGRPSDNPLIVHISSRKMLETIIDGTIPEEYERLIDAFWPGPLTMIFQSNDSVSPIVRGNSMKTVAVRMPANPQLLELIEKIGAPLAAPSANTSGKPSPTIVEHVVNDLGEKVQLYIDDGPCELGLESTVIGYDNGLLTVFRPGCLTVEQIESKMGKRIAIKSKVGKDEPVMCPGQKYRHYSPNAPLYLFYGERWKEDMKAIAAELKGKRIGVTGIAGSEYGFEYVCNFTLGKTVEECCQRLFYCLRALDESCDVIFTRAFSNEGAGLALNDRLEKAALYKIGYSGDNKESSIDYL